MTGSHDVDFLVIGSGIAGLWFSYRAGRKGRVLLITKKEDSESNTNYAQGGIAAAFAPDDSPRLHYDDTIRTGGGITHPDVARLVTEAGPRLVRELFELGVQFTSLPGREHGSEFDLGREGGHSRQRIVHAHDFTGLEIERGLLAATRGTDSITILQEHFAIDLAIDEQGRCCGAWVLDKSTGEIELVRSRVCMIATGGIGQAYLFTTNPRIATGDGIAMAYRAGARIANMEFTQFHPTSVYGHETDDRVYLVSEAVRGEGALLYARDGTRFMPAYHPDAELAPRDVVARAIAQELKQRGDDYVLLDATVIGAARLESRFPRILEMCGRLGIDIRREPIPVVPAAHYVCGGAETDIRGETSIPGLFAAGECACSGLHGANRLASNSLLEALVFADCAASAAAGAIAGRGERILPRPACPGPGGAGDGRLLRRLKKLMWERAGIVRTDDGLKSARTQLTEAAQAAGRDRDQTVAAWEERNLLAVSRLVVECALRRPESRGLHYNVDHPMPDARFAQDTVTTRAEIEGC
jgi:L-aspartate oxidase